MKFFQAILHRIASATIIACLHGTVAFAEDDHPLAETLLSSSKTVIGQPIVYPEGKPKVTAVMITMQPGQETGWHRHDAPLYAYMLEGNITVDYGKDGTQSFSKGDSLLEAFKSEHNGKNTGESPAKILVVFMGAEGIANSVMQPQK